MKRIWLLPLLAIAVLGWTAAWFAFGVMFERHGHEQLPKWLREYGSPEPTEVVKQP